MAFLANGSIHRRDQNLIFTPKGVAGDPYWASVILLAPLSADFDDKSTYDWTITNGGGSINSTDQWNGLNTFNNTGGLSVPDNDIWRTGTGAFCFELDVFPYSYFVGQNTILGQARSRAFNFVNESFVLSIENTGMITCRFGVGASETAVTHPGPVPTGAWSNICVRRMDTGNTQIAFNGSFTLSSSAFPVGTNSNNSVDPLRVGMIGVDMGATYFGMLGRFANIRMTKGAGRYAGNYTPAVAPFPIGP